MLDVGSGGASLGMLAKRRYDVQVVSTVFADWPYCEYITERGQICMYVDAMEAMPFAKFSYDVVHSSWVFHALFSHQLRAAYLEQNRILRPGGYMWIYGNRKKISFCTFSNFSKRAGCVCVFVLLAECSLSVFFLFFCPASLSVLCSLSPLRRLVVRASRHNDSFISGSIGLQNSV